VAVAQGVDGDAAGEVQQLSTALIPDARTQAAHRHERRGGGVGNHERIEIGALNRRGLSGHRSISCHGWPSKGVESCAREPWRFGKRSLYAVAATESLLTNFSAR